MIPAICQMIIKHASKPRTPEKVRQGIETAEGETARYFNSSLRKKRESTSPKKEKKDQPVQAVEDLYMIPDNETPSV